MKKKKKKRNTGERARNKKEGTFQQSEINQDSWAIKFTFQQKPISQNELLKTLSRPQTNQHGNQKPKFQNQEDGNEH